MRSAGKQLRRLAPMLAVALMLVSVPPARADSDHDRARQALEAGEILPLKTVLERLARDTPGQVMEVELERSSGRWIYEIKLLRPGGALVKLKVDARDGTVLGSKSRSHPPAGAR